MGRGERGIGAGDKRGQEGKGIRRARGIRKARGLGRIGMMAPVSPSGH